MKSFSQTKCMLVLLLLWTCPAAYAKDYIVEIILFANVLDEKESSLQVPDQAVLPNFEDAIPLDDSAVFYDFLPLSQDELRLHQQAAALATSGKYRILKHVAWLQPGLAKEEAIPVRIHAGMDYSNESWQYTPVTVDSSNNVLQEIFPTHELDGTIKVVLGRYLHVFTDLIYRRPFKVKAEASHESDTTGHDFVLADYALKAHRKMRSKELHYIDHPFFGILIEIHPAGNQE